MKTIEVYWSLMNISLLDFLIISAEIESPQHYAAKIKEIDSFYGYLAWSEVLMRSQDLLSREKSEAVLKELVKKYPTRPEPYIKLWYYYYFSKSFQSALSIAELAFLKLTDSLEYSVIINLNYARSLFKLEKYRRCFELLQMMYTKNSQLSVYLYHYGRMCLKSKDTVFLGSAIGALEECLKICNPYRHGNVYYWLMKGYLQGGDKVQAFDYAKTGIQIFCSTLDKLSSNFLIERGFEKKILTKLNEMKNLVKEMHIEILNIEILQKIIDNFESSRLEEAKIHCRNIMKFDPDEGTVLNAQLLIVNGEKAKALKMLYGTCEKNTLRMKGFFVLCKVLLKDKEYAETEEICKNMMKKCKSTITPVQIWIKTHMLFIKCLLSKGEYEKSVLILKSLAQVQPPPFIPDLDYTKNLQFATSRSQLVNTIEILKRGPILGHTEMQEAIISRARLLCSKRNLSSILIGNETESFVNSIIGDVNEECEIGSRTPEPLPKARVSKTPLGDAVNTGFSVSTSYMFLYLVGKIAAQNKVCIDDGYYALHDFLNFHHYWMREGIENDEKMKVKAQYWFAVVLHLKNDVEEAVHLLKDILSMLFQLNMEKKYNYALEYLKEHNSN